jgi:tetraacyldisaccharide 4'-kinase
VGPAALAQLLWRSPSPGARLARALLLLPAGVYRAGVGVRNAAYDLGVLRVRQLPGPSVGVGNIAVGGVGKTPVAAFLAQELARRGAKPGILLRGYRGGDEAEEHRARTPEAVVVADADRRRGAAQAIAAGAQALVLDDCLQRRDLRPDVLLAVVAAETAGDRMWPLPAGPWREGLGALGRCDGVVVTYKTATADVAAAVAKRLAPRTREGLAVAAGLEIARLVPLVSGTPPAGGVAWLDGRDVVAVCGIGEPALFRAQLERLGARVRLAAFGDHHRYRPSDLAAAFAAAGPEGVVVTTAKDATRLRPVWPQPAPACVVAELDVRVTCGEDALARLLDHLGRAAHSRPNPAAAVVPPDRRMPT